VIDVWNIRHWGQVLEDVPLGKVGKLKKTKSGTERWALIQRMRVLGTDPSLSYESPRGKEKRARPFTWYVTSSKKESTEVLQKRV